RRDAGRSLCRQRRANGFGGDRDHDPEGVIVGHRAQNAVRAECRRFGHRHLHDSTVRRTWRNAPGYRTVGPSARRTVLPIMWLMRARQSFGILMLAATGAGCEATWQTGALPRTV